MDAHVARLQAGKSAARAALLRDEADDEPDADLAMQLRGRALLYDRIAEEFAAFAEVLEGG